MLDSIIRKHIDAPLNLAAKRMAKSGISADSLSWAALALSLGCFALLAYQHYMAALAFFLGGRLLDGLDGALARHSARGVTDRGAFLDITFDMIFYAGFVFFFALGAPDTALYAAFLLFCFMGTASSFLAFAVIAEKRGITTDTQGQKSFFYLSGLAEGTETIIAFILVCLLPQHFSIIALLFGTLCLLTTAGRILAAIKTFK